MKTTPSQSNVSPEERDAPIAERLALVDEEKATPTDQEREQALLGEDRLLVLCDGVFAIAITLLVLNIKLPSGIPNEAKFNQALGQLLDQVFIYVITFVVVAGYWLQHRRVVRSVERMDGRFTWLTFLFLAFVAFFPVTSSILGSYSYRGAVLLYTLAFAGCGFSLIALWLYAAWDSRLLYQPLSRHEMMSYTFGLSVTPTYFSLSLILLLTPLRPNDVFWSWLLLPVFYRLGRWAYHRWKAR